MKLSIEDLRKAGYVNIVLIVGAIILRLFYFNDFPTIVKADAIICIISLIFGLIYSINGYTKNVAKDYKMFMLFYAFSILFSVVVPLSEIINGRFSVIMLIVISFDIIPLICALLLTFIKDLGQKKSSIIVTILFLFCAAKTLIFIANSTFIQSTSNIAHLVQAIIAYIFVCAKYADKEARGTK